MFHTNRNESLVNTELVADELSIYCAVHKEKVFKNVNCNQFSFIKISIYSGTEMTLKVEFTPPIVKRINLTGTLQNRTLTLPTTTHTFAADTYKYYVLPIEGESVKITLTPTVLDSDTKTYMKVSFSNNFHYSSND